MLKQDVNRCFRTRTQCHALSNTFFGLILAVWRPDICCLARVFAVWRERRSPKIWRNLSANRKYQLHTANIRAPNSSDQMWTVPVRSKSFCFLSPEPNRQDRLDSEAYLSRNATGARVPRVMRDSLRAEHQRSKVHTQSETRVHHVTIFGTCCFAHTNYRIISRLQPLDQ